MRIGTRLSTVAVASCLIALALYGAWSLNLRQAQLYRDLEFEEQSLSAILRGALETALEPQRDVEDAGDVVEKLSSAERVYGIAVHARGGGAVAMSDSLKELSGKVSREAIDQALRDGQDREIRIDAAGHRFLVHVLPLKPRGSRVDGVAEVWRDLGYIDEYIRQTAIRLVLLAVVIGGLLTVVIVGLTRRSVTRPAAALIGAMESVAAGDLSIRVAEGKKPPEGELGDIARAFDRLARGLEEAKHDLEASVAERAALSSRLRQSERLATLGQIVAEVAHEIGTPLNVIAGRAEETLSLRQELQEGGDAAIAEHATRNAATIHEQARRITRMMQRLLDLARERMPVPESVPLRQVARRVGEFLAPDFAARHVTLKVEGDERARARADGDMVQQVLINLVVNALQASPAGGTVRVKVTSAPDAVQVDVADDGPGVSPDILPVLFEAFATTKPRGQGTGLGLSISRSILRELGGSLRYAPGEGGRGAVFTFTLLPAADDAATNGGAA